METGSIIETAECHNRGYLGGGKEVAAMGIQKAWQERGVGLKGGTDRNG